MNPSINTKLFISNLPRENSVDLLIKKITKWIGTYPNLQIIQNKKNPNNGLAILYPVTQVNNTLWWGRKRPTPQQNNQTPTIQKLQLLLKRKYEKCILRKYLGIIHIIRGKGKVMRKKFKFETVQEYMDSVITWKRLGSKRDAPHDTIRKWKSQVIKMYQDPSISALNREGNTILWDWIKKHLVMEGDEKTYPEIVAPLKGPYIRRHIIGLLENKKYRSGKATSVSRAAVYRWMNLRGLYCKSIDHVEDRPKSEEDKKRDNTRFFPNLYPLY
ncbi:hypothetical protein M0812_02417 [Anaeramoeba flamelloides]|uniref:Uncharacterized protein n=1 Tax=Anaeramoeba flamelloides TaxID=1746091 RepID=A0AAV7YP66_9EUKA|nr:hypothetical protein M0812_02417 [Anaeramoeba flamelloides]